MLLAVVETNSWISTATEFLTNVFIAIVTGAYTGWFVTRYIAFQDRIEAVRAKIVRIPDLVREVLEVEKDADAQLLCMSRFVEECSYCKYSGHESAAEMLIQMGRLLERDLLHVRCNVLGFAKQNRLDELSQFLESKTSETIKHALTCAGEVSPDYYVLFLGKGGGAYIRNVMVRAKKLQLYLDGKAEDWK